MSWVAAAVVGSAVVGGVASSRASGKAADAAKEGQDILAASRAEGKAEVMRLFPEAERIQQGAFRESQDFLAGQVLPQQVAPFQQGNVAAQETLLAGLPQIQRAILGQPTNLSGLQARSFQAPSFDLTGLGGRPDPNAPQPASGFQLPQAQQQSIQDALARFGLNEQQVSRLNSFENPSRSGFNTQAIK